MNLFRIQSMLVVLSACFALPVNCYALDEAIERVIAGIERNYSQIHSARLIVESVSIQPNVERRETRTSESPNGAVISYTVGPLFVHRSELILRGDHLRSDLLSRADDEWHLTGITIRRDDVWTLYHPDRHWAQIKPTSHLGGRSPIDPRQFGAGDWKLDLTEELRKLEVVEVLSDDSEHDRFRLATNRRIGPDTEQTAIYEFDPSRNFLPTLVANLRDDGSINDSVEIDYQEVIPGTAWLFRDLSRKFFTDENDGEVSAPEWHQQIISRTVGQIHVNEEIPDEIFRIEFPEGTRVVDQTSP